MDIYASNWNEDDNSNTTAAPDGAPEGMAPSGVNNVLRAHQGAVKRYVDQNIPKTTGGTTTAYTLSYSVAPGALVDGMTHLVQFNAVNGASPTLNVNSLGALPLHFFLNGSWAALPANMLSVDQVVEVAYNSAAGTYRCIALPPVLTKSFSAQSTVDFTGIPSNVNNLTLYVAGMVSADGISVDVQTYNASAALDAGGSDYSYIFTKSISGTPSVLSAAGSSIRLCQSIYSANPFSINASAANIQALQDTQFVYGSHCLDSGTSGSNASLTGGGRRTDPNRITGARILTTSGTFTGKASLVLS